MKPCVPDLPAETCRLLATTLARVGDKWSMLIIVALEDGALRFNILRRRIGISQKVLTSALRGLERDGYVKRTMIPMKPPGVEYALTEVGQEVLGPVRALASWALSRVGSIEAARQRYDAEAVD